MPLPSLSTTECTAWLTLLRTPGVGPATLRSLIARCGDAAAIVNGGPRLWREFKLDDAAHAWLNAPDRTQLDADLAWLRGDDCHLVTCTSVDFPPQLARIADAPAVLFVRGEPATLWSAQIAIVGSRNASAGGLANARDFASAFARSGLVVTSGLADGIDGAAHAAALDAGAATIAVCGTGLDRVYPAKHRALAERIAAGGALVSEFPLGTPGCADHFPRRNRIIAGLSLGTVVVEASLKSGSLITARLAAEQGREVFAIPGSIHHPLARGCHRLIRDGAKLIETAADVLEELGTLAVELGDDLRQRLAQATREAAVTSTDTNTAARRDDAGYRALRRALGRDPVAVDTLVERSGLTAAEVSSMLMLLELEGEVVAQTGACYVRIR